MALIDRPFALPMDSIEITINLPIPPSTNLLWRWTTRPAEKHGIRTATGGSNRYLYPRFIPRTRVHKSTIYQQWIKQADAVAQADRMFPVKQQIMGPFEAHIRLVRGRKDGDNMIKPVLDWCQARGFIKNDANCRRGTWEIVPLDTIPRGCQVTLRSLHEGG